MPWSSFSKEAKPASGNSEKLEWKEQVTAAWWTKPVGMVWNRPLPPLSAWQMLHVTWGNMLNLLQEETQELFVSQPGSVLVCSHLQWNHFTPVKPSSQHPVDIQGILVSCLLVTKIKDKKPWIPCSTSQNQTAAGLPGFCMVGCGLMLRFHF